MTFEPQQRVKVKFSCEVIGKKLRKNQAGVIYKVTNSLGEPIYQVNFDNGFALPMRGEELIPETEHD
jgi:hypothetical protein